MFSDIYETMLIPSVAAFGSFGHLADGTGIGGYGFQLAEALARLYDEGRLVLEAEFPDVGGVGRAYLPCDGFRQLPFLSCHHAVSVVGEVLVYHYDVAEAHIRDVAQLAHLEAGGNDGDVDPVAGGRVFVEDYAPLEVVGVAGIFGNHGRSR